MSVERSLCALSYLSVVVETSQSHSLTLEPGFRVKSPGYNNWQLGFFCAAEGCVYEDERVLLQLRVLGFGLLQDGDVGVGIFPEGEKVFVGGECADTLGICISTLRSARF